MNIVENIKVFNKRENVGFHKWPPTFLRDLLKRRFNCHDVKACAALKRLYWIGTHTIICVVTARSLQSLV